MYEHFRAAAVLGTNEAEDEPVVPRYGLEGIQFIRHDYTRCIPSGETRHRNPRDFRRHSTGR